MYRRMVLVFLINQNLHQGVPMLAEAEAGDILEAEAAPIKEPGQMSHLLEQVDLVMLVE